MPPCANARRPLPRGRVTGDTGAAVAEHVLIVLLLVAVGFGAVTLLSRYDTRRPLLSDAPGSTAGTVPPPTTTTTTAPTTTEPPTTTTTTTTRAKGNRPTTRQARR